MPGDEPTLAQFFAAWELFREPALAGALAGLLLGYLGVFVVLRQMVFLSAALSQAAGLGVTAMFFAQSRGLAPGGTGAPVAGGFLATLVAALALLRGRDRLAPGRDTVLGLVFTGGAAAALVLGSRMAQEMHDVQSVLYGSAVVVSPENLSALTALAAVVMGLHLWWQRGLILAAFDPESARVRKVPVTLLEATLLVSLALAISFGTRVLGALPVFAFSVLPAMAAIQLAPNARWALALAGGVGAVAGFGGYLAAFLYRLPVGASQSLAAAACVALFWGAGKLRRP